jgi:hypothetical protein
VKNTLITSAQKVILFLGYTVAGSQHDYTLFKQEFDPTLNWFATFKLWVDLGYLGIKTDYAAALEIYIPHKKPRKSAANPAPALESAQKMHNQQVSRQRIGVEHAIGFMKRFRILTTVFRNHKANFADDVALIAAALSNWMRICPSSA